MDPNKYIFSNLLGYIIQCLKHSNPWVNKALGFLSNEGEYKNWKVNHTEGPTRLLVFPEQALHKANPWDGVVYSSLVRLSFLHFRQILRFHNTTFKHDCTVLLCNLDCTFPVSTTRISKLNAQYFAFLDVSLLYANADAQYSVSWMHPTLGSVGRAM